MTELPEILEHNLRETGVDHDEPWLVGVSGGRDSVALLAGLRAVGLRNLRVVHVEHGLRGAAGAGDAEFVRELAERWELPVTIETVETRAAAEKRGLGIEEAARDLRRAVFLRCQTEFKAKGVMLGHQAEDQAETVLFNLLRGGSPGGISGMQALTEFPDGLRICRPLLNLRREVLEKFLRDQQLKWREDHTNAGLDHTRNRLRHEVFPLLENVMGRDVVPAICRMAEIFQAEDELLADLTSGSALLNLDPLPVRLVTERPVAIQRRILFEWLKRRGVRNLDFEKIEQARGLLNPNQGAAKINLPGDQALRRRQMHLHVERQ